MKGDEIIRACYQHRNETITLEQHISKYKNMRKWMVKFLRKLQSRGDKIARVTSILIIKINQFTLILYGIDVRCDVDIIKQTARTQSIYREINEFTHSPLAVCSQQSHHTMKGIANQATDAAMITLNFQELIKTVVSVSNMVSLYIVNLISILLLCSTRIAKA